MDDRHELKQDFLALVDKAPEAAGGHWKFLGNKIESGYGIFPLIVFGQPTTLLAQSVSYFLHTDQVVRDFIVPSCGYLDCVNPEHLELQYFGESPNPPLKRVKNEISRGRPSGAFSLEEAQVDKMWRLKREGYDWHQIADYLGLSYYRVRKILKGHHYEEYSRMKGYIR